jgi:hypothetical protein
MKRPVKLAFRVAAVDLVEPFRSLSVPLPLLRADGIGSKTDPICMHRFAFSKQRELPGRLQDQNAVGLDRCGCRCTTNHRSDEEATDSDESTSHI